MQTKDRVEVDQSVKRCIVQEANTDKKVKLVTSEQFTFDFVAQEENTQQSIFLRVGKNIID